MRNSTTLARRATNAERLLYLLSDGEWHSSFELLNHAGIRYSSRLHELRKYGRAVVEKEQLSPDEWRYRMTDAHRVPAILEQMRERNAPPPPPDTQLALV